MPAAATPDRPVVEGSQVSVRITLPAAVFAEYESQAKHRPVEDVIAARLEHCVDHTSSKALYFSDAQRQTLERVLGRNVKSAGDAVTQIGHLVTVKVEKVSISLKLNLLQKLKTRCLGLTWEKFLEQLITQELERHVGLR